MAFAAGGLAQAQLLVAPGTKGTLTVEYDYSAVGSKPDKYDPKDWRVSRKVSITAQYVADKQQPLPSLHALDTTQQANLQNKQTRAVAAEKKMAPLMADMEKIVAKCGDDDACIERQVMSYGSSMQITPDLKSAGDDIAAIGKQGAPRYQLWRLVSQSGSYALEETYNGQTADPICQAQPNKRCTRNEIRKGGGALPPPQNGKSIAGSSQLEVDGARKDMLVALPMPLNVLPYTRSVTGNFPGEKTGAFPDVLTNILSQVKPLTVAIPADVRNVSGTETIKSPGTEGEGGTLTVKWRFSAQ
jgi:hypothetical protein